MTDNEIPAPFGSLHMVRYWLSEAKAARVPAGMAIDAALAELDRYQELTKRVADAHDEAVSGNREGMVSRNPADTSAKAASRVEPRTGSQRARVLALICECGGATDFELSMRLRLLASSVRPRRVELIKFGYVVDSGETRKHRGSHWKIWRATPEGLAWYRRQGFAEPEAGAA
ncbi:hypothetical protein [Amycolatopsis pithecellobii]|uniref:Uncharacterized protein n=1 Tax=Amycolatopsis pithecellobii TaxID=664692 RepID=A0A6N7Z585_9PSEU|nr:hypothetical protein [Amycolatopsis pithecellobii]MTD55694.1 hypothetical protein [Amycolatopsis pithecellobii]